ncbi:esterase [Aspergillus nomiae NRRL 13137]|uniref:Esterase n=1 Tax=Aspergillus nomiae NRRL (strain ATCC 15546 / NRRL 13137 / CBS 260.88 / M93) TaxID=1509407 RepID=A0A0L1JC04_ASPN3|nr:esterase [Aspergillus nomiae NRRL 13137]KNG89262.1 esterase [Aspergillus nomiae NRRL 13137]
METGHGDRALHDFQPLAHIPPLHNGIPPELIDRFDPVFVDYYQKYNVGRLHWDEVPIDEFRANPSIYTIIYGRATGPDVFRITEQKCPVRGGEITIRIFEPAPVMDSTGLPRPRAAFVNFHGGCWIVGGLSSDHGYCKQLVDGLNGDLVVFDVDYRLAPEHPYPVPIEDCWEAFQWIRREKLDELNLDPMRFAVGGVSAGGHISAVVAHLCRDNQIPLRLQVLCVPICDLHNVFTPDGNFDSESCPYESYREMQFSAGMTQHRMQHCYRQFVGHLGQQRQPDDWRISPILAPSFVDLAPALVYTAEMDPLRDEGEAYVAKLEAAGCRVRFKRVLGAPHSFAVLDGILESGKMFNREVIEVLKTELS